MKKGTLIIKLRSSSKKYPRKYFLDQEAVNICWTPSKKGDRAKSKCKCVKYRHKITVVVTTYKARRLALWFVVIMYECYIL